MEILFSIGFIGFSICLFVYYNMKEKYEKEKERLYHLAYYFKLQRTLFILNWGLEVLNNMKISPKSKAKEVLDALRDKGFYKYIEQNKFYVSDEIIINFKEEDNIIIFKNVFKEIMQDIRSRIGVINNNGFIYAAYLHPFDYDITVDDNNERFMPKNIC